jgi:hypothetical protein
MTAPKQCNWCNWKTLILIEPFEASQHMIHLLVTGAFRRKVLRWGAFCVKRWQPHASSGRWNHIKWFLPSSPQPSNLRFYSSWWFLTCFSSRILGVNIWIHWIHLCKPWTGECAGSYNARKVNLSQSGGRLRSDWSYKALVCNARIHYFHTAMLNISRQNFNIQSLKFLSYSVLLLASSYSAWIQNFLTLKAQGYLKLGDGERALRACKAPSGHCGSLGMSWGCQSV